MLETAQLNDDTSCLGGEEPYWWRRQCAPETWILFEPNAWAFVACAGASYYDKAVALAHRLADEGLFIEYSLGSKQFIKQLRHCEFIGAEMVIVGEDIQVRDPLLGKEEILVPSDSFEDILSGFVQLEKRW